MAYTTIDNPELYFQTKLYTGNETARSITLDGSEDMAPDLVWLKGRSFSDNHVLFDSVRGALKYLNSDGTAIEGTTAAPNLGVTAFNSDGFSLGIWSALNRNAEPHVAWSWKESATAGFDIVLYTGNGTDDTDISHSLSAVPHVMILKVRDVAGEQWKVYHHKNTSAPETDHLRLHTTDATTDDATVWSDEVPTSSVFTLGNTNGINENTKLFVAYLFSEKQGYSKFGSYIGNGNADGTFVYTGFRPAYVICKNTSGTGQWGIKTAKSQAYNGADVTLFANAKGAESAFSDNKVDLLSNGFKILTASSDFNTSGSTYIYMAFAEAPLVNSNGVPCNAR